MIREGGFDKRVKFVKSVMALSELLQKKNENERYDSIDNNVETEWANDGMNKKR